MSAAHVYRAYDLADRLLYVGSSVDVDSRMIAHERNSTWWVFMARMTRDPFQSIAEARAAEVVAITTEFPRWNMSGRSADHPDGAASSIGAATWLHVERDVARRLIGLRGQQARLRREYNDVTARLSAEEHTAEAISDGTLSPGVLIDGLLTPAIRKRAALASLARATVEATS